MELNQLEFFTAVAETGSFTKAANHMYVSHSTASRAVSALEEELGVRLIERGNRVVALTEAGERLLPKAKEILRLADEIETEMRAIL
ncbi:MAG: LysR family transcriptional regulator [Bacillota bacterium]|nr:LysR family transcriptional regulator [Bacillota bacterium]